MTDDDLSVLLDAPLQILDSRPLGGGCISDVSTVTVRSQDPSFPQRLGIATAEGAPEPTLSMVVKRHAAEMIANFQCEAEGLRAIEQSQTIRVPRVFGCRQIGGHAYLAMECIVQGRGGSSSAAYRRFARQLADLHRTTAGKRIGWERDNYLGSAKQPNTPHETWAEFVADQRIGFQIRWARDQGLADRQLQSDCETIIARMAGLLDGRQDQTSLLHGDLWSGNYLFDAHGQPAIIDPAVYYGCREAEWGMIAWFGSCPAAFDQAYQERWPMPEGWQRRIQVYKLYHQLNHLNLFGSSYAGICRSTARRILG